MSKKATRLSLPQVTLCAAASVNIAATHKALSRCLEIADFAETLLFTDQMEMRDDERIRCVRIPRLNDSAAYSHLVLKELPDHINSDFVLIVQWDGFITHGDRWDPSFLDFDYIGAVWPHFDVGHRVGNGGFSLRSRRLLEATRDQRFKPHHPEDVCICRSNRAWLEAEYDIRFADSETAAHFSFERLRADRPAFGFHGIFNMVDLIGEEAFWDVYRSLDDKRNVRHDIFPIIRSLAAQPLSTSLVRRTGRIVRLLWEKLLPTQ
jgi:hypothetical protein